MKNQLLSKYIACENGNPAFKKVVLISEAIPNENLRGISQTIYNIFKNYPPEKIIFCKPRQDKRDDLVQYPFDHHILQYQSTFIPYINKFSNRVISSVLKKIDYFLWYIFPTRFSEKVLRHQPDAIILLSMSYDSVLACYKLFRRTRIKLIVYLMDDWMYADRHPFKDRHEAKMQFLLHKASGWMMISKYLTETLAHRYHVTPPTTLVVHNPVDEELIVKKIDVAIHDHIKIVYAGSIWPMHLDALLLTAQAIAYLRAKGLHIHLYLYCPEVFWNNYSSDFSALEIVYEGNKNYEEIHGYLRLADVLVVCSSFLPENKGFSQSSVQTKITDYLAAGKPVLSVGPEYSACNKFLTENNCGVVSDENSLVKCSEILERLINDENLRWELVENGIRKLKKAHTVNSVEAELLSFLSSI